MKIEDFTDGKGPSDNSSNNNSNTNGNQNNNPTGPPPPPNGGGGNGSGGNNPFAGIQIPPPDDDENQRPEALINYNDIADTFDKALFREDELTRMVTILTSKKKANALLIGDAGVGKTQLVEEFARQYAVEKNPVLIDKFGDDLQIEELRLASLISGKSLVGQLEKEIETIIDYASENNVILFIDEIHRLFSDQMAEKVGQDLKQSMARSDLKFIGATTTQEIVSIRQDAAFDRRWSDVIIDELTPQQTEEIVTIVKNDYETYHNISVPDRLIGMLVRYGDMYKKSGSHRPDTALTLLDRVGAHVSLEHAKRKQSNDPNVKQYLTVNPMPMIAKRDIEKVAKTLIQKDAHQSTTQVIDDTLDQSIIGQSEAKEKVIETIRRMSLNLLQPKRPHSFLFAGPSGTGKTEMAKQIAKHLFGSEEELIRLDMSEFSEKASINRIKGSPDGYVGSTSKQPLPFDALQSNPRQVILLDELEKAHPEVRLLFMQVLDEGSFTTERHTEIDFSRAIVIATTNAGVDNLNAPTVGFSAPEKKTESDIIAALKDDFPIELINRFEHVVAFDALTKQDYKKIMALKYNALIQEIQTNRPDLQFHPASIDLSDTQELRLLDDIADDTYNPSLNGRPAERHIQTHIENHILDNLNEVKQIIFEPSNNNDPLPDQALPAQQPMIEEEE